MCLVLCIALHSQLCSELASKSTGLPIGEATLLDFLQVLLTHLLVGGTVPLTDLEQHLPSVLPGCAATTRDVDSWISLSRSRNANLVELEIISWNGRITWRGALAASGSGLAFASGFALPFALALALPFGARAEAGCLFRPPGPATAL